MSLTVVSDSTYARVREAYSQLREHDDRDRSLRRELADAITSRKAADAATAAASRTLDKAKELLCEAGHRAERLKAALEAAPTRRASMPVQRPSWPRCARVRPLLMRRPHGQPSPMIASN